MNSFGRLFRDLSPETACPDHGRLHGQTKCRFCSYTVIPPVIHGKSVLPGFVDGVCRPVRLSGGGVFIPSAVQLDQDRSQVFADMAQ